MVPAGTQMQGQLLGQGSSLSSQCVSNLAFVKGTFCSLTDQCNSKLSSFLTFFGNISDKASHSQQHLGLCLRGWTSLQVLQHAFSWVYLLPHQDNSLALPGTQATSLGQEWVNIKALELGQYNKRVEPENHFPFNQLTNC